MAYNIRGKTLSTVIPASLYNKYPNFVTFLDKYYDWSRKSILYLNNAQGNLNLSSKFFFHCSVHTFNSVSVPIILV